MTPAEIDLLAQALYERIAPLLTDAASDEWLDVHGAAKMLNVSASTVERRTKDGTIQSRLVGRLRRYRRSDLLEINRAKVLDTLKKMEGGQDAIP